MTQSDSDLLRAYVESHHDDAFAALVSRHASLVYSAALRHTNGDDQLAKEITQSVFTDFAAKAHSLTERKSLSGWLYTATHFASCKAVRSESRRRANEQKAHAMQELCHHAAHEPD